MQQQIKEAYQDYRFHVLYEGLHNFCSVDMGSFYLDVIKDRLYTSGQDSIARRSAQTALYHILEAMVRWLAPILSFTAEEIWRHMPGQRTDSVFLATWYEDLFALESDDSLNADYWERVIRVRDVVSKALEKLRVAGGIGGSLNAEVVLYCDPILLQDLSRLQDELRYVLITSEARIQAAEQRPEHAVATALEGLWIAVYPSTESKCVRCWHQREDVGSNHEYPEICARCVDNVVGHGELRRFA